MTSRNPLLKQQKILKENSVELGALLLISATYLANLSWQSRVRMESMGRWLPTLTIGVGPQVTQLLACLYFPARQSTFSCS